MHLSSLDWFILIGTLVFIVVYGIWDSRGHNKTLKGFLKGGNEANWWTVGLSVMATQASAITFLSTPGQGYTDGLKFVQVYFGMPLAMIVICTTFIPIYHRLKVYTAYEYLEGRFDVKTRVLTSMLFLIQRGIAAGITIFAPAIILSSILGWKLDVTCLLIGVLVIIYTVAGGTKAVNATQKMQMLIILSGMLLAFYYLIDYLPEGTQFKQAVSFASHSGRMQAIDFSFDLNDRYNIWSGIIGGFFLSLSYFGTDQSQVQRYLSASSVRSSQMGLIFNAIFKIPMQYFILLIGVLVYVFYQYNEAPIFFNEAQIERLEVSEYASDFELIKGEYESVQEEKMSTARDLMQEDNINAADYQAFEKLQVKENELRDQTKSLLTQMDSSIETNDRDYVFINFILNFLPKGIIGLLLAMIFSAAMSSTAAELNALATTTTIDIHKRLFNQNIEGTKAVRIGKIWTLVWGVLAILFALYGNLIENLIQFVNIVGSLFYGSILGIFLVAFYLKKVQANAVFIAAILAEALVLILYKTTEIGFLWFNLIGCGGVLILALILNVLISKNEKQ